MADPSLRVFGSSEKEILDAVKVIAQGGIASLGEDLVSLLELLGIVGGGVLTNFGLSIYRAAWVLRRQDEASALTGQSLRLLLPVQVIEQELRGFGPVPEAGVFDLLLQHRAVAAELTEDKFRLFLRWMNSCGVLIYSRRNKTVRSIAPEADAALAGEGDSFAALVSPRTPFSNVVRLRRIIRQLEGIVTWADPHFGSRALEELVSEIDSSKVKEVRILSGNADNVLTERSMKDFKRFREELKNKGVNSDWRVDSQRDWHDRWLVSDSGAWNMPPVNNLYQNQYSEMLPTESDPPVEEWWNRSTSR
jgi:hypothetical protein